MRRRDLVTERVQRFLLNKAVFSLTNALLLVLAVSHVLSSLWLLGRSARDVSGLALATVVASFTATAFATLPAAVLATSVAIKSIRTREPPTRCLSPRFTALFRGISNFAALLTIIPCALGLSIPSAYATCSSGPRPWHFGSACRILKTTWALSVVILALIIIALLPLRASLRKASLVRAPSPSDTEAGSTNSTLVASSSDSFDEKKAPVLASIAVPPCAKLDPCLARQQQRYLDRQNSLSSQKAIYPYAFEQNRSASNFGSVGYHPFPRSRPGSALRSYSSLSASSTCLPSTLGSTTPGSGRSLSFSTAHGSRPSTVTTSSSNSLSRPSTTSTGSPSSVSRSRSRSRSAMSSSRRHRHLDVVSTCAAIPESPRHSSQSASALVQPAGDIPSTDEVAVAVAAPAPAWCPILLTHAPLSADPAIRRLTRSAASTSLSTMLMQQEDEQRHSTLAELVLAGQLKSPAMMSSLSRQSTTGTSILNESRLGTMKSSKTVTTLSSSTSVSSHTPKPARYRTAATGSSSNADAVVRTPASPRSMVSSIYSQDQAVPPLPPLSALPPTYIQALPSLPTMVLPKRAAGHTYKPVQPPPQTNTGLLRPPSSGSTIRHLRRPSPLRTSVSANAAVGRRQSQSQSLSRSRSRSRSALRRPSPLRVRKAGQAPSADLVEQQNGVQGGQTQVSTQAQAPARPGSRGVANVSQERGQGRNVMAAPEKKNVGLSPDAASAAGHKRSPSKMWNEVMQRGRVEGGGGGGGGGAPIIVTTTPDSEGGIMSSPGAHKPQKSRMERYEAKVWAQGRDTSQSHSQGRAQGQVAKMRSLRTRKGRRKRLTGMMSSVGVGVGLGVSVNGNGTGAATGKSVHEQRGRERIRREPRGRVDGGTGTVVAS